MFGTKSVALFYYLASTSNAFFAPSFVYVAFSFPTTTTKVQQKRLISSIPSKTRFYHTNTLTNQFHNNRWYNHKNNQRFMSLDNDTTIGMNDIGTESQITTTTMDDLYWRDKIEVSSAKSRKVKGGNYVQLATVDPQTLEPRCRTVVFRGFLQPSNPTNTNNKKKSCIMKMITDARSNKVAEVTNTNQSTTAEMVWWFSKSSEQYRIRGKLIFIGAKPNNNNNNNNHTEEEIQFLTMARKQQWGNLSDMAREQFYWNDPGMPYDNQVNVPTGGRDQNGNVLPPPDNFLLMLLYPNRVDYLRLSDNFHQVDQLVSDEHDEWTFQRVNP